MELRLHAVLIFRDARWFRRTMLPHLCCMFDMARCLVGFLDTAMLLSDKIVRIALLIWMLAATTTMAGERTVQTLANFPVLQKLSRDEDALRGFLDRCARIYAQAGYGHFARELRRSTRLVSLYGQPEDADNSSARKKARATLLRLRLAMKDNHFIAVPTHSGESIPDFFTIATTFIENAKTALENLARGKNIATSLRNKRDTFWLTNDGNNRIILSTSGNAAGSFSLQDAMASNSAGTLTLSGGNVYSVGTSMVGGTLAGSGSTALITSVEIRLDATSYWLVTGSTLELNGGKVTILGTTGLKWLALPPGTEVPSDLNGPFRLRLAISYTVNGVELPPGTLIFKVSTDYDTPPEAIVLPDGDLIATPTAAPTPTPTPAE